MEEAAAGVSLVGPELEPFILGFLESPFRRDVESFVEKHAHIFSQVCPDGSYPLEWTALHQEYRAMFERQLRSVVVDEGLSMEDFREFTEDVYESATYLEADDLVSGCRNVRVAQFFEFVRVLTASTDFDRFLRVMFNAMLARQAAANSGEVAAPTAHEIHVTVPDGILPGQVVAVEYLGARYELTVPEGCVTGSVFRAHVTPPVSN
mmetsp:Transcript_74607/g.132280  ORF Transcript_74607/g.132280 Transcript_74607/m.132280 type:complete len:207 (-) Transcript_74607:161-781(-)